MSEFFIGKVLMKEKTIQKLKADLEESVAQLEKNVKTVQVLEQTIQELKNENTLLSEKVSYIIFYICIFSNSCMVLKIPIFPNSNERVIDAKERRSNTRSCDRNEVCCEK